MRYFGSLVRAIRMAQGKKVKPMAAHIGVTATYLRMIEDRKRRPSYEVAQKIAAYLGLGPGWVAEHGVAWPAAWFDAGYLVHGIVIEGYLPNADAIDGMQILGMQFTINPDGGPPLALGKPTREQIHYLEPLAFVEAPAAKKKKGLTSSDLADIKQVKKNLAAYVTGSATIVEG